MQLQEHLAERHRDLRWRRLNPVWAKLEILLGLAAAACGLLVGIWAVALTYPHIVKANAEPARLERGPRVRVAQIVTDYLAHGWSPDEMCRQHPYLLPAEAHAAMGYYFDHQEEIEAEIEVEWREAEQARASASRSPF